MLGKLFKHEMKATARAFVPLIGVMFAFTILNKIMYSDAVRSFFWNGRFNWITGIIYFVTSAVYGILIGAVFVATLLVLVQRFHKNLLGDEGYLMNTLPVHPWQHIAAKSLTSCIWIIINSIAALLAIMIMAVEPEYWSRILPDFWRGMQWMAQDLGMPVGLYLLELIVTFLICAVGAMLPIYASISAGQSWKKHKIIGSIVVYIVLNTVCTIIYVKVMESLANQFYTFNNPDIFHLVLWISTLMTVALYAACFWFTNRHLSKRLNLE